MWSTGKYWPEDCARFVDCQAYYDEVNGLEPTDTSPYDFERTCWTGTQEASDACQAVCSEANERLADDLEDNGMAAAPCGRRIR